LSTQGDSIEIEIGVPDRNGGLEILQIHIGGMSLAKDVNLERLADKWIRGS
jgi:SpoVK/Ycf46/Vps4 family AAA+-type ATPase